MDSINTLLGEAKPSFNFCVIHLYGCQRGTRKADEIYDFTSILYEKREIRGYRQLEINLSSEDSTFQGSQGSIQVRFILVSEKTLDRSRFQYQNIELIDQICRWRIMHCGTRLE